MNIFVTDKDPRVCAEWLDDKRVNKMILESAQMLSTAIMWHKHNDLMTNLTPAKRNFRDAIVKKLGIYKPFGVNHEVNKWARKNRSNYFWLLRHFLQLCNEYEYRFEKLHSCRKKLNKFLKYMYYIPEGKKTPFVNYAKNKSKGIDYTGEKDVYTAYQLYLCDRWETDSRRPKWNGI